MGSKKMVPNQPYNEIGTNMDFSNFVNNFEIGISLKFCSIKKQWCKNYLSILILKKIIAKNASKMQAYIIPLKKENSCDLRVAHPQLLTSSSCRQQSAELSPLIADRSKHTTNLSQEAAIFFRFRN